MQKKRQGRRKETSEEEAVKRGQGTRERVGVQTVRTCLFFALVVFLRCGHLL